LSIGRITPAALSERLRHSPAPLLLDARRRDAFRREPLALPHAVPIHMDEQPPQLPDLPRSTPIVVYCLCNGQASSTRVARWLDAAGYRDIAVLDGGWPAWLAGGGVTAVLAPEARRQIAGWTVLAEEPQGDLIAEAAFLRGLALPARRDLAVLFVDMVDSTRLFATHAPEQVLGLVQAFMEIVTEIAVSHCGDVHDFEGDGAMLYFASPTESLPAAFAIRDALAERRVTRPDLPEVRMALDFGPLVIGRIGGRERRGLSFIGTAVHTAARLLKLAPPGGIAATEAVMNHARASQQDHANAFLLHAEPQHLKGFDAPVSVYLTHQSSRRRKT
jgi:class 3 adenylate cyclase